MTNILYTMPGQANEFFSVGIIDGRLPTDTEIDQGRVVGIWTKRMLACCLKSYFISHIHTLHEDIQCGNNKGFLNACRWKLMILVVLGKTRHQK